MLFVKKIIDSPFSQLIDTMLQTSTDLHKPEFLKNKMGEGGRRGSQCTEPRGMSNVLAMP